MTQGIKKLLAIFLGLFSITVGLNWFLLPHDIASTGVGVIGYLVETVFSIQRSVTVQSVNLIILLLAAVLLGKSVFFKTVAGSLFFLVALEIIPKVEIISSHFSSLISGNPLFSLEVHTLYTVRALNGSMTIPPIIFHKFFQFPMPQGLLLTNSLIAFLDYYVFGLLETLFVPLSITVSSLSVKIFIHLSPVSRKFE